MLSNTRSDRLSRRKLLKSSGALCLLSWISWRYTPLSVHARDYTNALQADYYTATGSIRAIDLREGGKLWINTASAITVSYDSNLRYIEVVAGEVLVQTAPDTKQRPFIVSTQHGRMQALGTRFNVHQQSDKTLLAVYEGAVEITTQSGSMQTIYAGQQTHFNAEHIQPAVAAVRARQAWAEGLIIADDISLSELVTELQRYRTGHLGIDPAVANLRVMGTYPINQPDHILAMLEKALPVRVNRILPWWVTLEES